MSRDTCMVDDCNKPAYVVTLPHLTARQTFYMLYNHYTSTGWTDDAEGTVTDNSGDDGDTDPDAPVYVDVTILRHHKERRMLRLILTEYEI